MTFIRIAVWSGPRNISTALLRSFGNRDDTFVSDEPLYASYLARTGYEHPGRDEILGSQPHDIDTVFRTLLGPVPGGKKIWYQKHMAHHLPDDLDCVPLDGFRHAMLIREPTEMLTSLLKVIPEPTAAQTGLPQQLNLWKRLRERNSVSPPVLDSGDVLANPAGLLSELCRQLGIDFQPSMLSWPAGTRDTDGVWAKHWYGNVIESTGFGRYQSKNETVPESLRCVLAECELIYHELAQHRLTCCNPTTTETAI